jgi:hypothetical protein
MQAIASTISNYDEVSKQITPQLYHVSGKALENIEENAVVAILKARNELGRLPFWLAYHRWLGVDHFVVFNNRSSDGSDRYLSQQQDVTHISAVGDFRGRMGYREWIRVVLNRSPWTRWHLLLDADELFIAAPWRKGGLRATISAIESEGAEVASALMIDCYPAIYVDRDVDTEEIPWLRSPLFDRGPYGKWRENKRKLSLRYRGVRERLFWPRWRFIRLLPSWLRNFIKVKKPPHIIKWPLLRRSAGFAGLHHTRSHDRPSSYFGLLHYKIDAGLANKARLALEEGQYYKSSIEYSAYNPIFLDGKCIIKSSKSCAFNGLKSLMEARLCHYSDAYLRHVSQGGAIDTDINEAIKEIYSYYSPV